MRKKYYNKYTSIPDRLPFIIVSLILACSIILIFQFKAKYPMPFFSGAAAEAADTSNSSYSILVASPADDEVFNFINKNEFVPIEIKSRQIEELEYSLNLVINDKDIIKTFKLSPYKYSWHPLESGEYTLVADLIDNSNKLLARSNRVKFEVNLEYKEETAESLSPAISSFEQETLVNGIPTINLEIYEGPTYSAGDNICYYRVRAIVTGNPEPAVFFSKDDSGGVWGPLKTQINLTRNILNYTLTATAKNSAGQAMDSITLNWGCGPPE